MTFNERIAERIQSLNDTDRKVMKYILSEYETIPNKKIAEIAKLLFISPNAVIRFAKKLGYSGFSEMKYDIQNNMSGTLNIPKSQNYYASADKMIKNMQKTVDMNREKNFYEAAKSVAAANKIVFISLGLTQNATKSFTQRLEVLNKVCVLSNDRDNALTLAKNLDNTFLAFFVSFSGNSDIIIRCANYFKEKNTKIISLTGFSQNYLQEVSDISLYSYSEEHMIDHMDVSSRVYIEFMLDLLYKEILANQLNEN